MPPYAINVRRGHYDVVIMEWTNKQGTAYTSATITDTREDWKSRTWEAKSLGPSSCGVNKSVQAAERLHDAIRGACFTSWGKVEHEKIADAAVEVVTLQGWSAR